MHMTTVLLFALATFLLTVSPGPGVLYVMARSLAQGRRAGFASMFGIEFGEVVWIAAAATGVAALLSASVTSLDALRFAGAAYLVYLGIQPLRQPAAVSRRFMRSRAAQARTGRVAAATYVALGLAAAATGVRKP